MNLKPMTNKTKVEFSGKQGQLLVAILAFIAVAILMSGCISIHG